MEGGGGVRGGLEEEEKGDERSRLLWKGQLERLQAAIGPDHTCTDLRGINGSSNYSNSRQLAWM